MTLRFLRVLAAIAVVVAIFAPPDEPWAIGFLGSCLGVALGALYVESR